MGMRELVKGVYETETERGTKLVVGNKFNHIIQQIEQRYPNQKIIRQTEEKGSFPLFWRRTYKIEIESEEVKSSKTIAVVQKPIKNIEEKLDTVIDMMNNEDDFYQNQFKTNSKDMMQQLEQIKRKEDDAKTIEEQSKIKELEEMLRKKEEESKQLQEESQKKEKEFSHKLEEMMKEVVEKVSSIPEKSKEKGFLSQPNEEILLHFYEKMLEKEITETNAKKLILDIQNQLGKMDWTKQEVVEETLLEHIANEIKVTGKIDYNEEKVISVVGPTGVGKTTTIAKIGAYLRIKGKKIGFITTDTFRIGAVKQLQIYAGYLESPFYKVETVEELKDAIKKLKFEHEVDNILIDTVGRNPLDNGLIEEIKQYLDVTNADHISLVLSSTMKTTDAKKIIENFKKLGLTSLIFTKLDETMNHGLILNAMINERLRVSYVTNGQDVPDDIYRASSVELAKKVLNGVDEFESKGISS